jgi:hypothetical protein
MLWRISKSQSQRQSLQPTSWFVMALKEELTPAEAGTDSWAMETMRWGVSVALKHHVVIHFGTIRNSFICIIVLRIPSVLLSPWLFVSIGHCKLWFSHEVKKNSVEKVQLHTFGSSRFGVNYKTPLELSFAFSLFTSQPLSDCLTGCQLFPLVCVS